MQCVHNTCPDSSEMANVGRQISQITKTDGRRTEIFGVLVIFCNLKYLAYLSCSNSKDSKPRYFSAYVLPPPLVVCLPLVSWTDETSGAERLSQNQRSTKEWQHWQLRCLSSHKKRWFWCMSPYEALLLIMLLLIYSWPVWTSMQLSFANTRSRSSLASLVPLVQQVPWALLRVWPSAPLIWKICYFLSGVSGRHWTAYSAMCSIVQNKG